MTRLALIVVLSFALAACDRPTIPPPPMPPHPPRCFYTAYFEWGSYKVWDVFKKNVEGSIGSGHCDLLAAHRDLFLCVTGHTDRSGNEALNRQLSLKRAKALAEYLIEVGMPRVCVR